MTVLTDEMFKVIQNLPDSDKLRLVDVLLQDLDKPDPEIDRVWADEAGRRWRAYRDGKAGSTDYGEVMSRYRGK
jgi:hypothetical protein